MPLKKFNAGKTIIINSYLLEIINKIEHNEDTPYTIYFRNNKLYGLDYKRINYYKQLKVDIYNLSQQCNIDEYDLYEYIKELIDEFKNIINVNIIELLKIKIMVNDPTTIFNIKCNEFCLYNDFISFNMLETLNYLCFFKRAKNYFGLLNE